MTERGCVAFMLPQNDEERQSDNEPQRHDFDRVELASMPVQILVVDTLERPSEN